MCTIRKYGLTFLFLSLLGCNRETSSNLDHYEIYNVVIDEIIGKEDKWRRKAKGSLFWLNASLKTKEDSSKNVKLINWLDSTNKVIDTAKFYLIMSDKLIPSLHFDAASAFAFENNSVIEKDSSFTSVLKGLYKSSKSIVTLDRSKIRSQGKYKIVDKQYSPRDEFKEIGILSLSRISFDSENSKACVYTSFTCGSLCGYGRIFFLEKANGKWFILGFKDLWIS